MNEGRRGFLTGAQKMIGGAIALSVLPGEAVAKADVGKKLIWTPELGLLDNPLHKIVMAPNSIIQNCNFFVVPNCSVDGSSPLATIRNCYFDTRTYLERR